MRLEHKIDIAAPVDSVWELTTDVEAWPEYTPTMTSVERLDDGPIAVGSQARIKQPAQGARVWTVSALDPLRHFAWSTRAMGTRMTGGHEIEATEGGTRQTLTINIEGKLAPLVGLLLRMPIRKAIRQENEGFKAAAEATVTQEV